MYNTTLDDRSVCFSIVIWALLLRSVAVSESLDHKSNHTMIVLDSDALRFTNACLQSVLQYPLNLLVFSISHGLALRAAGPSIHLGRPQEVHHTRVLD